MPASLFILKTGLILFWALWLSLVFLTNACEGLKELGVLPERWKFASDNYAAIKEAISVYSAPDWLSAALFVGVVVWQGLAVFLFWVAFLGYLKNNPQSLYWAFAASLGIWAALMVADEAFRAYEKQGTHLLIFVAQLASLLAIVLLPG